MFEWLFSLLSGFLGILVNRKLDDEVLCINSRGIHFVEQVHGCERALHLRNKLLGNRTIKYIRRGIFGYGRDSVRQILKSTSADGEYFLSTLP